MGRSMKGVSKEEVWNREELKGRTSTISNAGLKSPYLRDLWKVKIAGVEWTNGEIKERNLEDRQGPTQEEPYKVVLEFGFYSKHDENHWNILRSYVTWLKCLHFFLAVLWKIDCNGEQGWKWGSQEEDYYAGSDQGFWWLLSDQCQWTENWFYYSYTAKSKWQDCSVRMSRC